ncbi:MAG: Ig-like domain-containing protein, partial [Fibrobacter sp.]|nr:Ig-like domain-containing protein [Fibrobacter sp.]
TGNAIISGTIGNGNVAPTVSIVSPLNLQAFNPGTITIDVAADANDADGSVSQVYFYSGDLLFDSTGVPPYKGTLNNVTPGLYVFVCKAKDNSGAISTSDTVRVRVLKEANVPPTVEIVSPKTGDKVFAGSTLDINMTATDSDGEVTTILLYYGDTELTRFFRDRGKTLSVSYTYGNIPKGYYNFTCKAVDNSNDTGVSDLVSIYVEETGSSDLLVKYGVPTADPLPSINQRFTSVVTEGTDAPVMSNVTGVQVNWNLRDKGLHGFGIDMNVVPWYIGLSSKITHSFANANPECTINGSGINGLDGSYYVTVKESNLVFVEKTGKFAVTFKK